MDNDKIIKHLKEICSTSEPEEKKAFFQGLEDRGLTSRRPVVINHGDFLLRQFLYVGKWIWLLSAVLLFGCYRPSYCCALRGSVTETQETILLP